MGGIEFSGIFETEWKERAEKERALEEMKSCENEFINFS